MCIGKSAIKQEKKSTSWYSDDLVLQLDVSSEDLTDAAAVGLYCHVQAGIAYTNCDYAPSLQFSGMRTVEVSFSKHSKLNSRASNGHRMADKVDRANNITDIVSIIAILVPLSPRTV